MSLQSLYLKHKYGVSITKQSIDERFSALSVDFVKEVLKSLMEAKCRDLYPVDFLSDFNMVRIKDSTKFKVPDSMKDEFKGCGGRGEKSFASGVSIQYEYDVKTGKIEDLRITSSSHPDQRDAVETVESIGKNDLIIRDLGYFGLSVCKKIIEKKAYFLSRLPNTAVFDSNGNTISFKKLYAQMKRLGKHQMELPVLIGLQEKIPVRLIITPVPENLYEKRIREKVRKSRNRGCQTSEETKLRYRFNLFITNMEEVSLSRDKVPVLYRLRWQIELMFKYWKSIFGVDKIHHMKKHRYLCMLYAKLILIVIHLQMIYRLQEAINCRATRYGKKNDIENSVPLLSIKKCLKTLRYFFEQLYKMIRKGVGSVKEIGRKIEEILSENHWLESKKNKICLPQIINLFSCKSN